MSSWIRDYLYLPLAKVKIRGGSAGGIDIQFDAVKASVGVTGSLFLTWLIMGLWHGAAWTFALWGMWHAVFIFAYRLTSHLFDWLPDRAARIGGWGTTLAVVMLGWLPFRAPSLEATFALYARLLDLRSYRGLALRESFYLNVALLLLGMLALYWMTTTRNAVTENRWVRASADIGSLAVAVFVVFIFLRPISQFIYFQF